MKKSVNQPVRRERQLKIWGSGTVPLNGVELEAFVLNDGTPLIGTRKILKLLGRGEKGDYARESRPAFLSANNLQPFIGDELEEKLKGVEINPRGQIHMTAYHADILPLICDVYLSARQAGVLYAPQLLVAEKCEVLVRSFAKVGITALIYEQLGYEKYKHPDALRILIESYLSEEIRKWSKEFPDELFRQMDRIYGNEKTTNKNRPQYYAKFIRKYIYEPLEKGEVLKRLDEKNPPVIKADGKRGWRKKKHHQLLSVEIGINALRAQIWQLIGVLKTSSGKRVFENNYERLMGQSYQTTLWEQQERE